MFGKKQINASETSANCCQTFASTAAKHLSMRMVQACAFEHMVQAYRDIPVNGDEFLCNIKNAGYEEPKVHKAVPSECRKTIFMQLVHLILLSTLFQLRRFCFLAQYISTHKVTFCNQFWRLQMLFHCFKRHFELFIACAVQSILSQLIGISRLFTFIQAKTIPALLGSRLGGISRLTRTGCSPLYTAN